MWRGVGRELECAQVRVYCNAWHSVLVKCSGFGVVRVASAYIVNCCYAPRLLFNPCLVRFSIHHPSVNPCTRKPYLQAYAHTPLAIRYLHHSPTTHILFHSAHNHSTGTAAAIPPSSPSSPSKSRIHFSSRKQEINKNPACTFSILHHQYNNSHVHITFVLFTHTRPPLPTIHLNKDGQRPYPHRPLHSPAFPRYPPRSRSSQRPLARTSPRRPPSDGHVGTPSKAGS